MYKRQRKVDLLEDILHKIQSDSVLVFTKTKYRAERVALTLEKRGYRTASLQGNLSQSRRQAALDGFRDGSVNVLVATDIAARGLDISSISHVINYDMPDTVDAYIHRIGRTGRIGNTGEAFTLITSEDGPMVKALERLLKKPIERRKMEGFDYDAPAPVEEASRHTRRPRPQGNSAAENRPNRAPGQPPSNTRNSRRPGTAERPLRRPFIRRNRATPRRFSKEG